MNRGILAIWAGMLLAPVFGVVPIVVRYLTRLLAAARHIEQYTAECWRQASGWPKIRPTWRP